MAGVRRVLRLRSFRVAPNGIIDRLTGEDLMQLTADVGPVPWQVGAILRMDANSGLSLSSVSGLVSERIMAVPRLRQVLVRPPWGCGRPIWVDDPHFDVSRHVGSVVCARADDQGAVWDTSMTVAMQRLPWHRPLWRLTAITGSDDTPVALVVVFHHVLADGIGGLAVLARLVDSAATAAATGFPRPAPTRRALAGDALRTRFAVLSRLGEVVPTLRRAATELKPSAAGRAPVTTLNAPTGGRRQLAVTRADLAGLRHTAHAHGATINDVVLTAVTGGVAALLDRRGEPVDHLVVSVPVSARSSAIASDLGNRVGVMPVRLPITGDRIRRLEKIAIITRAHKGTHRGASAAVLAPIVRLLATMRLWHWFVDRQQLINVFETNLRGPDQELRFGGVPITEVIPITTIAGNVALSFAAFSYAGTMVVTIMADHDRLPDLKVLTSALQHELDQLAEHVASDTP